MGLFNIFKKEKSWEEENAYTGEKPDCPRCGHSLTKKYIFSGMYCENCKYGLDDDDDDDDDNDDSESLIYNHTAEKVLNCIGSSDRLNILLAILKKPMSVAEIVSECNLNSTGQAYHHMKPLLAADLITEDAKNNNKGVYIVQPHKVQGIIMLLAGIGDMVDETFSKGTWE